jgi:type I restriction enzyme S subunit
MIYWNRAACVTERDYKRISKGREPKKGAVLYTAVGSYGHAATVDEDKAFSFQRHIAILYPKPKELDPLYLATWLNSSKGRRWSDILAVGNAQKTVTLTSLGKFPIAVPPFEEQLRIRSLLEPVDKVVAAKEQKLSALETLKKSLMRDLLTGKVRIDPSLFKEETQS